MTTLLLVRHALCEPVGHVLAGRSPGVLLNAAGRLQAERLADHLGSTPLDLVVSSPLERARETAATIAARHGAAVETDDRLNEIDVGDWSGRALASLAGDPHWQRFNRVRSTTRPPNGETMLEVQARAALALERVCDRIPQGRVVLVSHLDVLRALLCHLVGIPLDHFGRLELAPASLSVVAVGEGEPRLLSMNGVIGTVPAE